jgi:hypothetical protein
MPLITVITAVKNAAEFLPETIASVQAQTMPDWRYVIVDDASEDATADLAAAAAAEDRRIEVIRRDASIGPYAAANQGAQGADSKFIARIDGDDVATPDRFALQLAALGAAPSAKGCAAAWRPLTDGVAGDVRRVPSRRNRVIKWMMWFRSNLIHSTLMIDTDFFHAMGGYGPEPIGEDFRTWSALVRAEALAIVDDPVVLYRMTPGQMTAVSGARDQPERIRISLEHLQQCAPGDWTLDDARDFRWIGSHAPFGPERALALLDRFERAWRADPSLDDADRKELARHTAKRRLRHLRAALPDGAMAVASASIRHGRAIVTSGVDVLTNKGPAWP